MHLRRASGLAQEGRRGVVGASFPSPLVGEGGAERRMRGLHPRRQSPPPPSRARPPPSPPRGEGKKQPGFPPMKFFSFWRSLASFRMRIALNLKNVAADVVFV